MLAIYNNCNANRRGVSSNYFINRWMLFSSFFRYEKNYLMSSLAMSVRPSVRPSSVEITLERGFDRSAEPIDLKIGLNMGN